MAERKIRHEPCKGTGIDDNGNECKECGGSGEVTIKTVDNEK